MQELWATFRDYLFQECCLHLIKSSQSQSHGDRNLLALPNHTHYIAFLIRKCTEKAVACIRFRSTSPAIANRIRDPAPS
eukprot:2811786-Rhodomonas_salina.1